MNATTQVVVAVIGVSGVLLGVLLKYLFDQVSSRRARRERIGDDYDARMRSHWDKVALALDGLYRAVGTSMSQWLDASKELEVALDGARMDAKQDGLLIIAAIGGARDGAQGIGGDTLPALVGLGRSKRYLQDWVRGDMPTFEAQRKIQTSTDPAFAAIMENVPLPVRRRPGFFAWLNEIV